MQRPGQISTGGSSRGRFLWLARRHRRARRRWRDAFGIRRGPHPPRRGAAADPCHGDRGREPRRADLSRRRSAPCRPPTRSRSTARSTASCSRSISPKARRSSKGDMLAVIDPRPLQAALDQAQGQEGAGPGAARSRRRRTSRAFRIWRKKDFATQQSLDQQQAKVDQLKATIEADQARDRERADAARLRHHHGADRRPRRLPPGRCRQHRARRPMPIRSPC